MRPSPSAERPIVSRAIGKRLTIAVSSSPSGRSRSIRAWRTGYFALFVNLGRKSERASVAAQAKYISRAEGALGENARARSRARPCLGSQRRDADAFAAALSEAPRSKASRRCGAPRSWTASGRSQCCGLPSMIGRRAAAPRHARRPNMPASSPARRVMRILRRRPTIY